MIKLIWEIKPTVEALRAMRERLRDLRPAWRAVLTYLRGATKDQFRTEGGRGGARWKPLNPQYEKFKKVQYPGQPILRASDKLFGSLMDKTRDSILATTKTELRYGTRRPYGRYHQKGLGRNPRRQFLVVTEADRRNIKAIVREYLRGQSRLSGFEPL